MRNGSRTIGVRYAVGWDSLTDSLHYDIPPGERDVHQYTAVSFRISQRVNSASNPANQAQDLRLTLKDGGGMSRATWAAAFMTIAALSLVALAAFLVMKPRELAGDRWDA